MRGGVSVLCVTLCVFQEDEKFLTEVFAQLTDEATEDSKRRELVPHTHTHIINPSHTRQGFTPVLSTSAGELLQGVLCFLTNAAATEQRRLLQNAGQPGHLTCAGDRDGE